MIISLIAAVAKNRVIGKDNDLVWRLPDDMRYFMQTTEGHHVLMGRKNYESLPEKFRPLKNRTNIVVTRNTQYELDGVVVVNDLASGFEIARNNEEKELFIIGGGEIYAQCLSLSDRLYLTEIHKAYDGDAFFPEIDFSQWEESSRVPHAADDRHETSFDFVRYERKK